MLAEQTLGDIISHALKAERPCISAFDAQVRSAEWLAYQLADYLPASAGEVWDALTYVPDNMLPLLDTPQGWITLGTIVAGYMGVPLPTYLPTVH